MTPRVPAWSNLFRFTEISADASRYFAGWRGFSAVLVLIGHGFQIFDRSRHPIWGVLATSAVMVFFALSGFLIHKALSKSLAQGQLFPFLRGRINRIVPPFAFSMVLAALLWLAAPLAFGSNTTAYLHPTARTEFSMAGWQQTLFFLNGFAGGQLKSNGPLWSLSFEVWYYVAAFAVGLAVLWRTAWPIMLGAPMIAVLAWLNPNFAIFGLVWVLGFVLSAADGMGRAPRLLEWPFAVGAAIIAMAAVFRLHEDALIVANLAIGGWFVVHMSNRLKGRGTVDFPLFRRASTFSYFLYVVHFPILLFLYGAMGERAIMMPPALLMTLLFCAIVGPSVERLKIIPARLRD